MEEEMDVEHTFDLARIPLLDMTEELTAAGMGVWALE